MKAKTSELVGSALDWAVAKCEGGTDLRYDTVATWWITLNGKDRALKTGWAQSFCPSTNWAQGGPIIERECVTIGGFNPGVLTWNAHQEGMYFMENCPTPLIAAMRCYVASKLGDEIDIPDELI